ncbi:hypothetical protein HAALTHF_47530n [Vreelandella aquamarina]|nr:hypothetical protein HAALTHF_47530n [Halomonas axialensis]
MVAALRSEFGPLPDQSMHEKTSVSHLIEELYTFLKQADAWELNHLFRALDDAKAAGDSAKEQELISKIDNYETHIVPIIADIDAGFGNAEATYLLAKNSFKRALAVSSSKTRSPTRSSAATRMARSPFPTKTSWRRSTPCATPSWSWA